MTAKFTYSIITFGLALILPAQSFAQQPVGGWSLPIWETHSIRAGRDVEVVPDCTGDGVQDLVVTSVSQRDYVNVLDGKSGEEWLFIAVSSSEDVSADAHDLDGDGVAEVILRFPGHSDPGSNAVGKIRVVQGGTGQELWRRIGANASARLADNLIYTDLDGDGLLDIFLHGSGHDSLALNGATGAVIWADASRAQKAFHVPDVDQDGVDDFLIQQSGPSLDLRSGASGSSLWTSPVSPSLQAPYTLYANLDLTGDGSPDFVLANPDHSGSGLTECGGIALLDSVNGQQQWFHQGGSNNVNLGTRLEFFDANNDGTSDLLSLARHEQLMLNGMDGVAIWAQSLELKGAGSKHQQVVDLAADGNQDVLLRTFGRMVLVDGFSGVEVWAANPPDPGAVWQDIRVADTNADGNMEIIAGSPDGLGLKGSLVALSGVDGSYLWRVDGEAPEHRLGRRLEIATSQLTGQVEVISRYHGIAPGAGFRMFAADTGTEVWRVDIPSDTVDHVAWHRVDLNGDGNIEIVEVDADRDTRIRVIDTAAKIVRNQILARLHTLNEFDVMDDVDGDGNRDFILLETEAFNPNYRVHAFSGMRDSYTTGLTLVGGNHSVSNGGITAIGVTAPKRFARLPYRLLMSGEGVGYTNEFWADIPLADGRLLQHTLTTNHYPSYLYKPTGFLNAEAEADLGIWTTPTDLPAALAGTEITIAVLIEFDFFAPLVCSGPAVITITP